MNVSGQQHPDGAGNLPTPVAVQQTTVIQVGGQKSVGGAVALGLIFGPLGMLYATVPGAIVMFFVNVFVAIVTLGLGLLLTLPLCALWAGLAANSHNKRLQAVATQHAVGAPQFVAPAAAWHDDPEGSDRLRYYDGTRWTDHYADKPGRQAAVEEPTAEEPKQVEAEGVEAEAPEVAVEAGPETESEEMTETQVLVADEDEAPTVVAEAGSETVFCGSCGHTIGAEARFCSACGEAQALG